jgi:AraC family transcriptional regulator
MPTLLPIDFLRQEYMARINRVLDYIERHIDRPLSLKTLAEVAHFSPFHFHRIFKAVVGEPLNQFIKRVRIEKAAQQLLNNPALSITQIALDGGYSGSAHFARAFRTAFGMSPSQWRTCKAHAGSKNRQTNRKADQADSKPGQDVGLSSYYMGVIQTRLHRRKTMSEPKVLSIEVKELPPQTVAYVRHIGAHKADNTLFEALIERLMRWAGPREICRSGQPVLAIYHDGPETTPQERQRISIAISVPKTTAVAGDIGKMPLAGGKFVVARYEIGTPTEYEPAWNQVMGAWLPESGYQPDDRLCFEMYHNDPRLHPQGKHIVDICVPIKPL